MSERFEVHGNNDTTSTLIAKKYTLTGALIFAIEIADTWMIFIFVTTQARMQTNLKWSPS
jgi:hypothetical protein